MVTVVVLAVTFMIELVDVLLTVIIYVNATYRDCYDTSHTTLSVV